MRLADIVRAVQNELPITMRHEKWLARNGQPMYTKAAVKFAAESLAGAHQLRKRMMFRSSSTGMCGRRRMFSALGVAEPDFIDSKLANIFHTGNFLHLKWQMAGLSEGWLTMAEVPVDKPAVRFGGTLDGILHDGSGFEFKTINSRGHFFTSLNPKDLHIRQVHSYMYLRPDITAFSIIYENKDTAEWREMRVERNPKLIDSIDREIHQLNVAYEDRKLPPVLPDCQQRTGVTYRQCPFREVCLGIKKWPTVVSGKVVG